MDNNKGWSVTTQSKHDYRFIQASIILFIPITGVILILLRAKDAPTIPYKADTANPLAIQEPKRPEPITVPATIPASSQVSDWDSTYTIAARVIAERKVGLPNQYDGIHETSPMMRCNKELGFPWAYLYEPERQNLCAWALAGILRHPEWKIASAENRGQWSIEGMDEGFRRMKASGFDPQKRKEFLTQAEEGQARHRSMMARYKTTPPE